MWPGSERGTVALRYLPMYRLVLNHTMKQTYSFKVGRIIDEKRSCVQVLTTDHSICLLKRTTLSHSIKIPQPLQDMQ